MLCKIYANNSAPFRPNFSNLNNFSLLALTSPEAARHSEGSKQLGHFGYLGFNLTNVLITLLSGSWFKN